MVTELSNGVQSVLFKWTIPGLSFFIFVFFNKQLTVDN